MATMETKLLANPTDPNAWQQVLYAFLAEKERRSGSRRTVESYSRMLQHFFGQAGKAPDVVTSADVMGWAYGKGLSGRGTVSHHDRCAGGLPEQLLHFLIRMGILAANPCDALERPKVQPSPARGYAALDVQKILGVIPHTVAVVALRPPAERTGSATRLRCARVAPAQRRARRHSPSPGGRVPACRAITSRSACHPADRRTHSYRPTPCCSRWQQRNDR